MNNQLADALKKALKEKENNFSNYVWKGAKTIENGKCIQESEKIIDMTPERLNECYLHCKKMLYNKDPKNLGRYEVLEQVSSEINRCNVELLLRWYENTYLRDEGRKPILRAPMLLLNLRKVQSNNPDIEDWSNITMSQITGELPVEFRDIPVSDVLDGCTDYLG